MNINLLLNYTKSSHIFANMSKTSDLKVNNRWKMDSKEKKSLEFRKKKRDTRNESYHNGNYKSNIRYHNNPNEENQQNQIINNEESFPSLFGEGNEDIASKVKSEYLEKIKIQKEKDENYNKNILKDGWIAYRMNKGSTNMKVTRDGINYFNSLRETYTEEEWKEKEKFEFQKQMNIFSHRMEELYLKRKKESDDYYYETGKLDAFAIVEKEREEYEEYLKKFDEIEEEEQSEDEIIEDHDYNSENEHYKKR